MAEPKPREDQRDEQNPECDNLQQLLKGILSVPKKELDKRRDEYERKKERKRAG